MKKILLLSLSFFLMSCSLQLSAQVYLDEFDNDDPAFLSGNGFSFSEADSELTLTGNGLGGPFDPVVYQPHDQSAGTEVLVDATTTNKVFVRAKASNVGTQLRLDLQDAPGFATSQAGLTKTLTTEYMVLEYDFTGSYVDGGFGGTPCTMGPCPVDGSQIQQLLFFVNPGSGGFGGTIVIDYIAFGEEPDPVLMSDIFQDHFEDQTYSIGGFDFIAPGYTIAVDEANSEVELTGDGTSAMWDPFTYIFRNPTTLDTVDIDVSGNNKIYIKAKSSVEGTAFRLDVQDINGFVSTEGSITKILGTEYQVFEFDYTGVYNDLGFGGTPCTMSTAPCPLDPMRIANLLMFVEPGVGEFLGTVSIDYISVGTSLDPPSPPGVTVYGDHFNNNSNTNVVDPFGLVSQEMDSDWTITGDGTAAPFSALAYSTHDQSNGTELRVDATGNNKLYIRAKSSVDGVPLRIDLVDTLGFVTSQPSLTKSLSTDFQVFEYDFTSQYVDGGFGGTPCEAGPCPVDATVIATVLFYPNPVDGGFDGTITLDFVAFGAPLDIDGGPTGIPNYSDNYENEDPLFITDVSGLVSSIDESIWTITGDGTSGTFTPVSYDIHDQIGGTSILASPVASNDKLFVKARASVAGTVLRIDLQDLDGFVTSSPSVEQPLETDFTILEFDYAGTYTDGGFGGTPCTAGPCEVDGERIDLLQFFIDPGTGTFNGTLDIDWISFGQPIDETPVGIPNYFDDYQSDDLSNISDNGGLVSSIVNGEWIVEGDGMSGAFAPLVYTTHDLVTNDPLVANSVDSQDRLFVRAKSSNDGTVLRVDLQDVQGFVTSNPSIQNTLTTTYAIYEYNYAGTYTDGGFGGTPCTLGPCPVDGQRVSDLQFFLDPGTGAYNGTLSIDWISFGEELVTNVEAIPELEALKVYPNPAVDQIGISFDLVEASEVQLRLYDQLGQLLDASVVQRLASGNNFEQMNIEQFGEGIYFLQLTINGKNTKAIAIAKTR
ncbi:MAG: T9SS type A sorting domain-containing protein [Bacteroidota bacterium]